MRLVAGVETIKADLAYEQPYRFKLWLAAVEDSATLRMGFRAYLSHIRSSLDIWEKSGTVFVNAKNEKLNLDSLKADDLWGFLGKKNQYPQGPKRNIDPMKIAVIDVYIKKKYPKLAETFDKSAISPEVAAVLRSFFDRGLASESEADHIIPWSGIYISADTLDVQSVIRARKMGEVPSFVITAIMLRPSERPDFCVAHKVTFPLLPDYMSEISQNSPEWQKVSSLINHHRPRETIIYSGIALVAHGARGLVDIRLSLMLRDRTTYEPHLCQFIIRRWDDGVDETYRIIRFAHEEIGSSWGRVYFYCNNKNNELEERYSMKFINEMNRLYKVLGEEA